MTSLLLLEDNLCMKNETELMARGGGGKRERAGLVKVYHTSIAFINGTAAVDGIYII